MRIVILAPGSRGDVQPFIALSRALVARGHTAPILADRAFVPLATANQVELIGVDFDTRSILIEEQENFARTENPIALLRGLSRRGREMTRAWSAMAIPAARNADLVLAGGGAIYPALAISEALGPPAIQVMLQPFFPTAAFPSPILPPRQWPGPINRLSHTVMMWLFYAMFRESTNLFRTEGLGLPRWPLFPPDVLRHYRFPALCAVSPTIVPPPADIPQNALMTGYWFLDDQSGWRPDPTLAAFLDSGSPPLFVGFGSMADSRAQETTRQIIAALALSGQRAILARGWGGLTRGSSPEFVHVIDEAPHDRLLPHCLGILHHGGAGTTAAAFRAGVPQIFAPVMADQPFWAARATQLGVAAGTIPRKDLQAQNLTQAIARLVSDVGMRERAKGVARCLATENGVAAAVQAIEGHGRPTR